MNPTVLNPDPLAILKESNRINDPTRQPRIKDGFTIVDNTRPKTGGGWASDAEFNDSIKKNFDYTADNFNEAKMRAAREGKPLVVVVGNKNSQDTKQLVDGIIPGAKNGKNSAIYVFADQSKLDVNSELGREVSAANGDPNRPYTAIFAPRAGMDGSPQLERHLANTWGARAEIGTLIQSQLGSAQTIMDMRRGTFKVDAAPPGSDTTVRPGQTPGDQVRPRGAEVSDEAQQRKLEDEAEARLAPNAKTLIESFKQLKGTDYTTREALYDKAEKAASAVSPQDIALVKQKTSREMQLEMAKGDGADKAKLDNLKARTAVLDLMSTAPSWTRMNHGLSLMHFSQLDQGVAKIKEGAQTNPHYLNNPQFIEQLMKTPYDLSKLKEKLPEVKFDDYLKHKAAGTVDQFVAANKPPEVKPQELVTPQETKQDAAVKAPEKLKYDGADYEKALEDALNSGRRVVVKVGTKGCSGCDDMTANAWPDAQVQRNLDEKAVFVDVDGAKRGDLVESLDAGSWPTVLVVEPYRDPADGKIKSRTIQKIEPNTEEARSAASLNKFLSDNLVAPKATEVRPAVQPQAQIPPQVEINPNPDVNVGPVRPSDVTPEVRPQASIEQTEKAAFERLQAAHRKILEPLKSLNEQSDAAAIDNAFETAINNAKMVRPEDIATANHAIAARRQEITNGITGGAPDQATQQALAKLDADQAMVRRIDQSEAYLNISRGAVKLKMNPGDPEAGKADIRKGLDLRKELAQDPSVLAKLGSTGVDAATLKSWFPELPIGGDRPMVQPGAEQRDAAQVFDRLREQHALNLQPFAEVGESPTEQQIQDAYVKAIANARQVDPRDIQTALGALDTRRQSIMANANGGALSEADQQELDRINMDSVNYARIGQAEAILTIGLGARKMTADQANPQAGIEDIRRGLAMRPELANDPTIIGKLKSTGFDDTRLSGWFPGVSFQSTESPGTNVTPGPAQPGRPPVRK